MENGNVNVNENKIADTPNLDELDDGEVPDWLTANIFLDALKAKLCNFKAIKGFSVRPAVKPGENFMTVLLRVYIDVELDDAPSMQVSYIVKTAHTSKFMYDLVNEAKVFVKECYTYQRYLPAFEKMYRDIGKIVKFGPDVIDLSLPNLENKVLVMDDLRSKGFKNAERQKGMDMAHTKATLTKLAQFHAASTCYFELNGSYPKVYNKCFCKEDTGQNHRNATGSILRECLGLYNDARHLDEKITIFGEQAPDSSQFAFIPAPDEFCVLNHGDLWVNNIMFQYDDKCNINDIYFVDFQFNRFGSPAQDLIILLLSSTNLETKLQSFDYFVFYYHRELTNYLTQLSYPKQLPNLRDLHIAIYKYGNFAYTAISVYLPLVLFDQSDEVRVDNMLSKGKGAELKRRMFQNERMIQHMKEILPWMDNRGLLDYVPWK